MALRPGLGECCGQWWPAGLVAGVFGSYVTGMWFRVEVSTENCAGASPGLPTGRCWCAGPVGDSCPYPYLATGLQYPHSLGPLIQAPSLAHLWSDEAARIRVPGIPRDALLLGISRPGILGQRDACCRLDGAGLTQTRSWPRHQPCVSCLPSRALLTLCCVTQISLQLVPGSCPLPSGLVGP